MSGSFISEGELRRVARLARLAASDAECAHLAAELDGIARECRRLPEAGDPPPSERAENRACRSVLREDCVTEGLPQENALESAPRHRGGHVLVPRVITR